MTQLALLFAAYSLVGVTIPSDWGRFDPPEPKVQLLRNGRELRLLEDLVYVDSGCNSWIAPRGSIVDGSSIPQTFWTIAGGPLSGGYRNAAIVHGVYCYETQRRNKHDSNMTHRIFYHAMRSEGLPESEAAAIYWGVANFGPSWETKVGDSGKMEAGPIYRRLDVPEGKMDQERLVNWAKEYFERHPYLSPEAIRDIQPLVE